MDAAKGISHRHKGRDTIQKDEVIGSRSNTAEANHKTPLQQSRSLRDICSSTR